MSWMMRQIYQKGIRASRALAAESSQESQVRIRCFPA